MPKPYEIIPGRITKIDGEFAEVPADAPPDLRTWSSFCFFAPDFDPEKAKLKIGRPALAITQVEGGVWIYDGYRDLCLMLDALGQRQR